MVQTISKRECLCAGLHKLKVEWELKQPCVAHARVNFVAKKPESPRQSSSKYDPIEQARLRKRQYPRTSQDVTSEPERAETVSGRWLVKAMLATLAVAGLALYLTVCLLFYQGQWQFTFSPPGSPSHRETTSGGSIAGSWARRIRPTRVSHSPAASAAAIAASSGLPISDQPFDYTEEGVARLDGWWIPAQPTIDERKLSGPRAEAGSPLIVLFCPDGRSDLPGNIVAFQAFHALGISVFAFDYRGFGASQPGHPSQQKSYEDGTAALRYLTATRHIDPARIVLYGAEVGAAVAVHVAQQSPRIAAVILENPQPSFAKLVKREQHIHLLPMWLIFPDRFEISRTVPRLKMPKLVIVTPVKPEYAEGAAAIYDEAVAPRQKVRVDTNAAAPLYTKPAWQQAVRDFLDSLATQSH